MEEFPRQLARTARFTRGVPEQFTITADGSAVLFLRTRSGEDPVTCLWSLDLDSGNERLLADPAELLDTPTIPIGSYATDRAGSLVAFALAGQLWTVSADGEVRHLPAADGVTDPRPDPDGRSIAYASQGSLRLIGADGSGDRALAVPEGPDVTFGVVEQAGTIALRTPQGFWWSPDGTQLLVARVDSTDVELWHVADPAEPAKPPRGVRYPAAGTANAKIDLFIISRDGSPTRVNAPSENSTAEYVAAAGWDEHGPYAAAQSRDQRSVRFLAIDPATGHTKTLTETHDERWVQLVPGSPTRTRSGAIVAHADENGTRYLTVGGSKVTPEGLQLAAVLSVDGDDVLFAASDDPLSKHLWLYRHGQPLQKLATGAGIGRSGVCVVTQQRRVEVLREGRPAVMVKCLSQRPVLSPRVTHLVLGARELRAALYLPSWHHSHKLPVLVSPYGGLSRQLVTAETSWPGLVAQWFAEHGFAVLVADGRGTPGRGPEWERAVHGDLFGAVLEDQVTALREAARLVPDLDLDRVGIRGWSFGGAVAMAAVLRHPDVFHAAVAGAGPTDQRLYNTHWRERTLGHPDEFPERYEQSSLLRAAPNLTRPLLLMHGLADTNVFPLHTLRMSQALLAAGRPHETLLLPGIGHAAIGFPATEGLLQHQLQFLTRHLEIEVRK
jgi:dipeptidyl-peptidase-4